MKARTRVGAVLAAGAMALTALSACTTGATSTAMCAFVIGDGSDGHDSKIHKVVYPSQQVDIGDSEDVRYVPCNSRNYIINDGSVKNANGQQVGDRSTPSLVYTKTGTAIKVWTSTYWTLNEADAAMRKFYELCYKYTCASKDDKGGDANFSTPGWNGMLGENFGSSLDAVALKAASGIDDDIWEKHSPDMYKKLGDEMSAGFADMVRAKTGYSQDLFCGSGNSGWKDADNPGKGDFNCTSVRVVVDRVDRGPVDNSVNGESALKLNAQRLNAAKALYGDDAGFWLGLQDSISQCKSSGITCVFNVGGTSGTPGVQVPVKK